MIVDWSVRLGGEESTKAALARVFPGPDPSVVMTGDQDFVLNSSTFLRYTEPLDVMNAAHPVLARMCGLLNLYGNYHGEVWAENAVWIDEHGSTGGTLASVRALVNIVDRDCLPRLGTTQAGSKITVASVLYHRTSSEPTIAKLLEVASWHPLSWGDVYLLYELLREAVGGDRYLADLGAVPKARVVHLRRTANSFRHANPQLTEGFQPMALNDARPSLGGLPKPGLIRRLRRSDVEPPSADRGRLTIRFKET